MLSVLDAEEALLLARVMLLLVGLSSLPLGVLAVIWPSRGLLFPLLPTLTWVLVPMDVAVLVE